MPFPISILQAYERLGRKPTPYDFNSREIIDVIDSLERCIGNTYDQDVLNDLQFYHEQFTRFLDKSNVQNPEDFFGFNIQDLINQKIR